MPALFTYHFSETDSISCNIRIKARGQSRIKYCSFPPVMLNFKNTDKENFHNYGSVKLVSHCLYSKQGDINIFKEYLIYKLYNELTPFSFNVQLFKIKYIDTQLTKKGKLKKPVIRYGFIIEPLDLLANRLKCTESSSHLSMGNIEDYGLDRVAMFNYLIGNADWSVARGQNIKLIEQIKDSITTETIPIPYDFDFSGLVSASYAVPSEESLIQNIKDRYYKGLCRDTETLRAQINLLQSKRSVFNSIIKNFQLLDDSEKEEMLNYLDSFFGNTEQVIKDIKSTCTQ